MAASGIEVIQNLQQAQESGLAVFDDLAAHRETLNRVVERADQIIERAAQGTITDEDRQQLPVLLGDLELLLEAQMKYNGIIAQLDLGDGSYDNRETDEQLRELLRTVRNLNIDINSYFGTRSVKKISGWMNDLPYWFTIRWRAAKDYLKYVSIPIAVAGAGVITAYSIYNGGFMNGMRSLGGHVSSAWRWLASFFR